MPTEKDVTELLTTLNVNMTGVHEDIKDLQGEIRSLSETITNKEGVFVRMAVMDGKIFENAEAIKVIMESQKWWSRAFVGSFILFVIEQIYIHFLKH